LRSSVLPPSAFGTGTAPSESRLAARVNPQRLLSCAAAGLGVAARGAQVLPANRAGHLGNGQPADPQAIWLDVNLNLRRRPTGHDHPANPRRHLEPRPDLLVGDSVQRHFDVAAGHAEVENRQVVEVELQVAWLLRLARQ
jgi:hypothetical protein